MLRLGNKLLLIGGLAVIGLVAIAVLWSLNKKRSGPYAESHAIVRTRMDIQNALLAIRIYVRESGGLPEPLASRIGSSADAKSLYLTLFGKAYAKYGIGDPPAQWKEAGTLVDRWGEPLNIIGHPGEEPGTSQIRVWSNGPNRKNENGNGDDVSPNALKIVTGAARQ